MRILFVGDYSNDPRLGSAKVPLKLREEFTTLGHQCEILSREDLGAWPTSRHLRELLSPALALKAVRRAVRDRGPFDVIDASSAEGLHIALMRRLTGFPAAAVVARSNGSEHLNYRRMVDDHRAGLLRKPVWKRWWHPLARLSQVEMATRLADRAIAINAGDRDFVIRRGWKRGGDIDLIGHGVSSRFAADVPLIDEPRGEGILFCGSWCGMKGVDYLARAFSMLITDGYRFPLTILGGSAPEAAIRAYFPPGAQALLRIVDRVSEEDVMGYYRRHDLLVFPSTYEGFGMVLLEAMSQRLPVVSTPVGAAGALVRHGQTGMIVPLRSAVGLAEAIRRMMGDAALRTRLAEAAYLRVRDLNWTKTAKDTLATYEKAIRSSRLGWGPSR